MDAFDPFFKDEKYREVISKFAQLEKNKLDYVSFKITPADFSKIIIPKYVKELAIEYCMNEVSIINLILRSFVVEQLEGTSVNFRKILNIIKSSTDLTEDQKIQLLKHITTNY